MLVTPPPEPKLQDQLLPSTKFELLRVRKLEPGPKPHCVLSPEPLPNLKPEGLFLPGLKLMLKLPPVLHPKRLLLPDL